MSHEVNNIPSIPARITWYNPSLDIKTKIPQSILSFTLKLTC